MLKLHVTSLDEVDEADRRHYRSTSDGFELVFEGGLQKLKNEAKLGKAAMQAAVQAAAERAVAASLAARRQPKPESEMSQLDRFFADAEERLEGLEGEARAAELAKIKDALEPVITAQIAEHDRAHQARVDGLTRTIRTATIEQAARKLVAGIAAQGADDVLLPQVLQRLDCEQRGEDLVVVANDAAGQKSTMSLEELADELRATPALRPVVRNSAADAAAHARRVAETLGARPH